MLVCMWKNAFFVCWEEGFFFNVLFKLLLPLFLLFLLFLLFGSLRHFACSKTSTCTYSNDFIWWSSKQNRFIDDVEPDEVFGSLPLEVNLEISRAVSFEEIRQLQSGIPGKRKQSGSCKQFVTQLNSRNYNQTSSFTAPTSLRSEPLPFKTFESIQLQPICGNLVSSLNGGKSQEDGNYQRTKTSSGSMSSLKRFCCCYSTKWNHLNKDSGKFCCE
ncbi:hypothetical protein CDAR_74331 [Caerostris darwini]|uniref:Uncharacterized protein n=1 Tax=Caerostris darwini TaxID=1538125 RepID=A0AAV4UJX6_9ARAC|nr:hypothetical protein CDAR_74331 [Caerostris darwini]